MSGNSPTNDNAHGVPAERFYEAAAANEDMVWRLCPYLRRGDDCAFCPAWEETSYGKGQRGCRALAEEALAVIMEQLELSR